ncbi:nucleoside/nucleotide kinase family protein [Knoellia sp. p5-6-4]|uniref:nucleoside/nucleotide kinase family protein n=1 Tax=unclassified Knoellia TaxID=2618719 RepID=UPI0023DA26DB|nr:nucleoside/nucleotide kinase family protein [Knoellia sp. p5-6-4]MDF2143933.1 nucleoside/nucleotide kinase family protein [Knoellia sp. p5-6-4]
MTPDVNRLLDRVERLCGQHRRRVVVGVAGPPGAGKTSLVLDLLAAAEDRPGLAGRVAHVPMDGFHLTNAELDRLGRRDRKGAPDTFDAHAYAAVLAAVRDPARPVVTAPSFDHAEGEPVPDSITVPAGADVVLTEGNYLLLDGGPWRAVRALLDEVWFCALADDVRRDRLVARHVAAGREPDDAVEWVHRSDEANAVLVAAGAAAADVVLRDGRILPSA